MAKGDLIDYDHCSGSYAGRMIFDKDSGSSNNSRSVYVSSASWWAQITINKNIGTWGRSFTLYASYWNGSSWVEAWRDSHSWGQFESGEWTYKYYHNSTLGSTSGDVADAVLWELHLDHPELYRKRLWVHYGGVKCMPRDIYNDVYRGRPIYSSGNLAGSSIYDAGDRGRNRDAAYSTFRQSADSGTLITYPNDLDKLVAYKYN